MAAIMVHNADPDFAQPSHVLVWAAMHLMPKLLGVVLLTGILAAGALPRSPGPYPRRR